jgi:hypothetical protein
VLLAAVAGLALSSAGCIIDGSSSGPSCAPTPVGCIPNLTVFWDIKSNLQTGNPPLTCQQAGGADTISALVDGGCFGSTIVPFDNVCASAASNGSFVVALPNSGTYGVSLELRSGGVNGTLLSSTDVAQFGVDCTGQSVTPMADMFVNF